MASSGSFTGSIINGAYTLRVEWTSSQSTENNTSAITCEMYLDQKKDYSLNISSRSNITTIDGAAISYTSSSIRNNGNTTVHLGTVTRTISHNADGSRGLYISSVFNINATIGGTKYTTIEASSGLITLPTIPRASSVSCASSADVGGTLDISVSRASSSFTHNLSYSVGGASGTIANGVSTSFTWSIPASLANRIASSSSASCTITCSTYSGGTWIGSKSTSFTLNVPDTEAFRPSVSSLALSDPTGYKDTYGAYIRGISRIRVQTSASGAYGSVITSYSVSVNGETGGSADYTSGPVSPTCPSSVTVTVRDSRGRTASKTESGLTFLDYASPSISNLTAVRVSDSSGATENDEGEYAKISFSYVFSGLGGKNSKSVSLASSTNTSSVYTDIETVEPSEYTGTYTKVVPASADNAYTYRVILKDSLSSPTSYIDLSTAETVFDVLSDGTGIAFGKVASRSNALDCDWDIWSKGTNITSIIQNMFSLMYPVGSIYLSVNSANPSSIFQGTTWVLWGAGRVPVGVSSGDADFGSVEKTGGEKSVALNSSQVPPSTVNTFLDVYDAFTPAMTQNSEINYGTVAYLKDRSNGSVTGTVAGGSQAHNNLQPYITCYMWKRTA